MGTWAGVSIGSNSIRLLVANTAPGEAPVPLVREEQVARLASQITRQGRLSDDAISNVVSVVWRYQRAARRHGAELTRVVGTAAVRQAANRAALSARLEQVVGLPLELLSGEEEAAAGYRAVAATYARPERVLGTCDLGGGSTELTTTRGVRPAPDSALSLPIGGRTLMHRYGLHLAAPDATWTATATDLQGLVGDPARALRPRPNFAVVLGGAGEVLVHMRLQGNSMRLARSSPVEGATVPRPWLESAAERLRRLDTAGRAAIPGIPPDRADIISAGAAILLAVMRAWDLPDLTITERNILDGLIPADTP
jgi:exopolyphosphatase/guanosine-5'-triphosphate,3'-diphosphate pyrophosphatase